MCHAKEGLIGFVPYLGIMREHLAFGDDSNSTYTDTLAEVFS